jgi:hypothetical protein
VVSSLYHLISCGQPGNSLPGELERGLGFHLPPPKQTRLEGQVEHTGERGPEATGQELSPVGADLGAAHTVMSLYSQSF